MIRATSGEMKSATPEGCASWRAGYDRRMNESVVADERTSGGAEERTIASGLLKQLSEQPLNNVAAFLAQSASLNDPHAASTDAVWQTSFA